MKTLAKVLNGGGRVLGKAINGGNSPKPYMLTLQHGYN